MGRVINLPTIQALAQSGAYGGQRLISANTVVTVLAVLEYMQDYRNWTGANLQLTDSDKDAIDAITASVQYDLTTDVEGSDMQLIAESEYTSNTSYIDINISTDTDLKAIKIIIGGLLSNTTTRWAEDLLIVLNTNTASNLYNSFGYLRHPNGILNVQTLQTQNGLFMPYCCSGMYSGGMCPNYSNLTMLCYMPASVNDYFHMEYSGMIGSDVADRGGVSFGQGTARINTFITNMKIYPVTGTEFRVNSDANDPEILRASVYGMY